MGRNDDVAAERCVSDSVGRGYDVCGRERLSVTVWEGAMMSVAGRGCL